MTKVNQFLKESKQEIKKVSWPTRQETLKYTVVIIVTALLVAAFLGGIDALIHRILEFVI